MPALSDFKDVVDALKELLTIRETRKTQQSESWCNMVSCLEEAANSTRNYLQKTKGGKTKRDNSVELDLSRKWSAVGDQLRRLRSKEARELARHCSMKATYWAHIDRWTDNQIKQGGIELEPLFDLIYELADRELARINKHQ